MSIFNVVIAEDEPLARARLQRLLSKNDNVELVGIAENGMEAIDVINTKQPDLVILDINMPVKTGLEVAKELQNDTLRPPAIIFTTAYSEFALDAFSVNATGYLLKPIYEADLNYAIEKAASLNKLQAIDSLDSEQNQSTILLKRSAMIEKVAIADITYFHAHDKLVIAGVKKNQDGNIEEEEIIVDYVLKDLEHKLSNAFCRIHRNTLVNTSCLEKMERDQSGHYVLSLIGVTKRFDVSRRQVASLKSLFSRVS